MNKTIAISLAAVAVALTTAPPAAAAGRDPMVIEGISAGSSGDPFRGRLRASEEPRAQPRYAAPTERAQAPRPVRTAPRYRAQTQAYPAHRPSTRGQYGGGFIEFLITGGQNGAAPVREPSRRDYRSHIAPDVAPARRSPPLTRQASLEQVPAFRQGLSRTVDPRYQRQEVSYSGPHGPGTIVVDTPNRFLYLVLGNGRALRYGIGVGRPGFEWSGIKRITRKAEWPDWLPPREMLKRRPDLPTFMPGGPENPLGARALYLGSSLYRIHGTNEPETIGTNVSSGCIRLLNADVIDLYRRVRVGAKVIVI